MRAFLRIALLAIIACAMPPIAQAQQGTGPIPNGTNAGSFGATVNSNGGHVSYGGGAPPAINAACGTAPSSVVGTDTNFKFKSGTSTSNTCAVTFAVPWNKSPICQITSEAGSVPAYGTISANGFPISGVADSTVYHVQCYGQPGG